MILSPCCVVTVALAASNLSQGGVPLEEYRFCGPNALYTCARLAGLACSRQDLIDWCNTDNEGGCSLADLTDAAKKIGFTNATSVQMKFDDIMSFGRLAILWTDKSEPRHFVAAVGSRGSELLVLDPPGKSRWLTEPKLKEMWSGYGVLLSSTPIATVSGGVQSSASWRLFVLAFLGGAAIAIIVHAIRLRSKPCHPSA